MKKLFVVILLLSFCLCGFSAGKVSIGGLGYSAYKASANTAELRKALEQGKKEISNAKKAANTAQIDELEKALKKQAEEAGIDWEKLGDYAGSGVEDLFAGARQRAIAKFGKEAEDIIYIKFNKDAGAAAEIIDYFGQEGLNALKKVDNIQAAANELIKGKIAYRHVGSSALYLNEMKSTGVIPARSGNDLTYFSLDKYDNPTVAIDKMQLNGASTDAV